MAQHIRFDIAGKAILALSCAALVAACSNRGGAPTAAGASLTSGANGMARAAAAGTTAAAAETEPTTANTDATEGPVNLPSIPTAPTTTVAPSQMTVHATAETVTLNIAPGLGMSHQFVSRAMVTWTPVAGAVKYNVYQLEAHEGQADDEKGTLCYNQIPWTRVAVCGGGLGGVLNLKTGTEMDYTVQAIDRAGNVIGQGKDNCAALEPLEIPYLKEPGQNNTGVGQQPYFTWTPSNGANGYYTEVFATKGNVPYLPMWRAYRNNADSMTVQYGTMVDVMPGTRPLEWSLQLNLGARYAWTVCAVRTDTGNMATAKAVARATAPMNYFVP